jgi:hypothetical protein
VDIVVGTSVVVCEVDIIVGTSVVVCEFEVVVKDSPVVDLMLDVVVIAFPVADFGVVAAEMMAYGEVGCSVVSSLNSLKRIHYQSAIDFTTFHLKSLQKDKASENICYGIPLIINSQRRISLSDGCPDEEFDVKSKKIVFTGSVSGTRISIEPFFSSPLE